MNVFGKILVGVSVFWSFAHYIVVSDSRQAGLGDINYSVSLAIFLGFGFILGISLILMSFIKDRK